MLFKRLIYDKRIWSNCLTAQSCFNCQKSSPVQKGSLEVTSCRQPIIPHLIDRSKRVQANFKSGSSKLKKPLKTRERNGQNAVQHQFEVVSWRQGAKQAKAKA